MNSERTVFYLNASLCGYALGLLITFMSMHYFGTAQPALLYILPTMILVYLFGAFGRKEFIKMIMYDEDANDTIIKDTEVKKVEKDWWTIIVGVACCCLYCKFVSLINN